MERTRVWSPDSRAAVRALIREVGRIGSNVNQIARRVNTHNDAAAAATPLTVR
ncbi:MAG: plasmid mobilization relaxosome protein MobC [Acidobacteriota bacterium]|nr:plasmid mobilization relaxosome protein MobC [Acidobacteriota bacterium]